MRPTARFLASAIRRQCPKLMMLYVKGNDSYSNSVMGEFEDMLDE